MIFVELKCGAKMRELKMRDEKSSLLHWFGILGQAGVWMPKTRIVRCQDDAKALFQILDGKTSDRFFEIVKEVQEAGDAIGYPIFLRTDLTSGKHNWNNTCFVPDRDSVERCMYGLIEFSACVDAWGLPINAFVIREFIPMHSTFTAFNGLPINKERRFFLRDGEIQCHHPYWPNEVIRRPSVGDWEEKLAHMNMITKKESEYLYDRSLGVAKLFDGYWSLDWSMDHAGNWWVIDMAEGDRSYHWPDCKCVSDR